MEQRKCYQMSIDEVMQHYEVQHKQGLTEEQVSARKMEGINEFSERNKVRAIAIFLNQFKDFMLLVLLIAALISSFLGEYVDAITILIIIVINNTLGFIQEYRAERSLQALKDLSAPLANVWRAGKLQSIKAREIVRGELIELAAGDRIPADVRFITTHGLSTEESALTGESLPVCKTHHPIDGQEISISEQKNMGFLGTMVIKGSAQAVVVSIGMNTEIGKIAQLMDDTQSVKTPLQKKLESLGKLLVIVSIALTVFVVMAGIWHGQPPYMMFLAGVSLAVAAIPEGLPAIVTVALALGVQRLIKRNAIVRKLPSVETLGCTTTICSDKTGTLTQNKMTVTDLWLNGQFYTMTGESNSLIGEIQKDGNTIAINRVLGLEKLIEIALHCNYASLVQEEQQSHAHKSSSHPVPFYKIKGDPTEGALLIMVHKIACPLTHHVERYSRLQEFPFDSDRKRMSIVLANRGERMIYTKGAPDVLIDICTHLLWDGQVVPFTSTLKQKVVGANEQFAKSARRVIALSYRNLTASERCDSVDDIEKKMIFVGLTGMIDPPRREVRDAILKCKKAGIRTVMITGDHQTTAEAIAKQIGIQANRNSVMTGRQLQDTTDEQLDQKIEQTNIFARVTPEHKLRIVQSFQRKGHVVAMTGDGVNDAPAIKAADIGISMGITGTDVSKEAADLILKDDHFATIISAIEEGRNIYENIRKFIRYLLASNVGEIVTMFLAMMIGLPLPLIPIQILWVNLVTDGLPAMALGVDQAEKKVMEQPPRSHQENIFSRRLGWKIMSRGIMIGVCTLIAFWLVLRQNPDDAQHLIKAQTVAFATLVVAQLIHVFDCRSSRTIFHRNPFQNKYLVIAVFSSLFLLVLVIYLEAMQSIFHTVPLHTIDWVFIVSLAAIPSTFMGLSSVLRRKPSIQTQLYRKKS
jgi:Ca2+-transporting ATPase